MSEADIGAERLIRERLHQVLPDVPLLAEKSFDPKQQTAMPERFLLVDPLDGTREFINRNGEFTVNIALVEAGQPIIGCVYAPARQAMYIAGAAAFRAAVAPGAVLPALTRLGVITTSPYPESGLRVVASRSHLDPQTQAMLDRLRVTSLNRAGSALKFCVMRKATRTSTPASLPPWNGTPPPATPCWSPPAVRDRRRRRPASLRQGRRRLPQQRVRRLGPRAVTLEALRSQRGCWPAG